MDQETKGGQRPASKWRLIGIAVAFISAICGLGGMLFTAIQMVRAGRGLETYRTFWLVEWNWLGFLGFCGVVVVALVIGYAVRLYEHMQWRAVEKKYASPKGQR